MIVYFTLTNAYQLGDVISSMHRLRYREFVERLEYDVPHHQNMEYDQYDTLVAVHFVFRDEHNEVKAALRISPTSKPYMIKDIWPQVIETIDVPETDDIWEATRLCIDPSLPQEMHKTIHAELLCALHEFALANGIKGYIGVAPPGLWKYTFIRFGWPIHFLGEAHEIDYKEKIRAGYMEVSEKILSEIRNINNISSPVLIAPSDIQKLAKVA